MQQPGLRLGLAVDQHRGHLYMVQALLIVTGDTGRCDKDSINAPAVEGFDDRHFLVGVIVRGTEEHAEARCTSHFFDASHNVTPEWISNRCHD